MLEGAAGGEGLSEFARDSLLLLAILAEEPQIDAIIVMLTTLTDPLAGQVANDMVTAVRGLAKPLLVGWIVTRSLAKNGMTRLMEARIPMYESPERVVLALSAALILGGWGQLKAVVLLVVPVWLL